MSESVGAASHILVADDDPLLLDVLVTMLKCGGYSAVGATNLADAVHAVTHDQYSLVLADLTLTGGDLGELLDTARSAPVPVPVVIVAGFLSDTPRERILTAGAAGTLMKPFGIDELYDTVRLAVAP